MKINDVNMEKVTPMMRQYIEIKKQNMDVIIFFRLGDFYELFFEDAIKISRELELTLTGKSAGLEEKIPMCGVPHHSANIYIEKLVDKGYKIGICEQLEDAKNISKGIVKRDIIQIISKGTIIDADSLDEKENNYIGSLIDFDNCYGLCFSDISTGVIYVEFIEHNISRVVSEIVSVGMKEIITTSKCDQAIISLLNNQFKISVNVADGIDDIKDYDYIYQYQI